MKTYLSYVTNLFKKKKPSINTNASNCINFLLGAVSESDNYKKHYSVEYDFKSLSKEDNEVFNSILSKYFQKGILLKPKFYEYDFETKKVSEL